MPQLSRTTAASNTARASGPGIQPSVAYDHIQLATSCGCMSDTTSTARFSSAASEPWISSSAVAIFPAALIFATACMMLATARPRSSPSAHMSRTFSMIPRNLPSAAMLRDNAPERHSLPSLLTAVATLTSSKSGSLASTN